MKEIIKKEKLRIEGGGEIELAINCRGWRKDNCDEYSCQYRRRFFSKGEETDLVMRFRLNTETIKFYCYQCAKSFLVGWEGEVLEPAKLTACQKALEKSVTESELVQVSNQELVDELIRRGMTKVFPEPPKEVINV